MAEPFSMNKYKAEIASKIKPIKPTNASPAAAGPAASPPPPAHEATETADHKDKLQVTVDSVSNVHQITHDEKPDEPVATEKQPAARTGFFIHRADPSFQTTGMRMAAIKPSEGDTVSSSSPQKPAVPPSPKVEEAAVPPPKEEKPEAVPEEAKPDVVVPAAAAALVKKAKATKPPAAVAEPSEAKPASKTKKAKSTAAERATPEVIVEDDNDSVPEKPSAPAVLPPPAPKEKRKTTPAAPKVVKLNTVTADVTPKEKESASSSSSSIPIVESEHIAPMDEESQEFINRLQPAAVTAVVEQQSLGEQPELPPREEDDDYLPPAELLPEEHEDAIMTEVAETLAPAAVTSPVPAAAAAKPASSRGGRRQPQQQQQQPPIVRAPDFSETHGARALREATDDYVAVWSGVTAGDRKNVMTEFRNATSRVTDSAHQSSLTVQCVAALRASGVFKPDEPADIHVNKQAYMMILKAAFDGTQKALRTATISTDTPADVTEDPAESSYAVSRLGFRCLMGLDFPSPTPEHYQHALECFAIRLADSFVYRAALPFNKTIEGVFKDMFVRLLSSTSDYRNTNVASNVKHLLSTYAVLVESGSDWAEFFGASAHREYWRQVYTQLATYPSPPGASLPDPYGPHFPHTYGPVAIIIKERNLIKELEQNSRNTNGAPVAPTANGGSSSKSGMYPPAPQTRAPAASLPSSSSSSAKKPKKGGKRRGDAGEEDEDEDDMDVDDLEAEEDFGSEISETPSMRATRTRSAAIVKVMPASLVYAKMIQTYAILLAFSLSIRFSALKKHMETINLWPPAPIAAILNSSDADFDPRLGMERFTLLSSPYLQPIMTLRTKLHTDKIAAHFLPDPGNDSKRQATAAAHSDIFYVNTMTKTPYAADLFEEHLKNMYLFNEAPSSFLTALQPLLNIYLKALNEFMDHIADPEIQQRIFANSRIRMLGLVLDGTLFDYRKSLKEFTQPASKYDHIKRYLTKQRNYRPAAGDESWLLETDSTDVVPTIDELKPILKIMKGTVQEREEVMKNPNYAYLTTFYNKSQEDPQWADRANALFDTVEYLAFLIFCQMTGTRAADPNVIAAAEKAAATVAAAASTAAPARSASNGGAAPPPAQPQPAVQQQQQRANGAGQAPPQRTQSQLSSSSFVKRI